MISKKLTNFCNKRKLYKMYIKEQGIECQGKETRIKLWYVPRQVEVIKLLK